jgi:two-component system response regulator HydG
MPTATERLIGESKPIRRLISMIHDIAPLGSPVLITGESGTGKELVAQLVHEASGRTARPFVPINVSAVPEMLLESQLFGHVKGAFTDARDDRAGLVALAHGGTLFLDEIGEMPPAMQVKLLRVLQERRVRPVGGTVESAIDFRLVCATNKNLEQAIATNAFRRDLYYRVNVIHLELPPLRERGDDVLLLAEHFLAKASERFGRPKRPLSATASAALLAWHWPGNVRELENCMEHAVGLASGREVTALDLPWRIRERRASPNDTEALVRLDDVTKTHVLKVLKITGGNRVRAAKLLGISRRTLYRRLEEWGVAAPADESA